MVLEGTTEGRGSSISQVIVGQVQFNQFDVLFEKPVKGFDSSSAYLVVLQPHGHQAPREVRGQHLQCLMVYPIGVEVAARDVGFLQPLRQRRQVLSTIT